MKSIIKAVLLPICRWYGPRYARRLNRRYVNAGRINSLLFPHAFASCGKNFQANGSPLILAPEKIHVGDNFTINDGAQLCPHAEIFIGNNVTMSRGSQITSGGLGTACWREKRLAGGVRHVEEEVVVGDGTWLCINAIVLGGENYGKRGHCCSWSSCNTRHHR